MMNLQQFQTMDSHLLLSLINMKLRNDFSTLDKLTRFYEIDSTALCEKLASINYCYQPEHNQFISCDH